MSRIDITIGKTKVEFRLGEHQLLLSPTIAVDNKEIVHAVGTDFTTSLNTINYALFEKLPVDKTVDRNQLLIAFFSFGIQEISKKGFFLNSFIKPVIYIHNVDDLEDVLIGYQRHLIANSLINSGARNVNFI